MLRLAGGQVESLFDLGLPVEVRELPADLAALDGLLADPALLAPVEGAWDAAARGFGRPTIPIERLLRLMVIKQRSGWGYETLVREVSDSLHLRRFCRIALTERVPDESTVRKLVRRLGPEVIEEITRAVIASATTGSGGSSRARRGSIPPSWRPTSAIRPISGWPLTRPRCSRAKPWRWRARRPGRVAGAGPVARGRPAAARLNRTLAARTGQGRPTALRLTGEAGRLVERSIRETRRVAEQLRRRARGRGAQAKLAAARRLDELTDRAAKVTRQIRQRLAGERITDRLVSISDPDARPIRKGKLRSPTEFGYVIQLAEVCENTRRGARGLIVPVASEIGSPNEPDLLPTTAGELDRLDLRPRELALDAGFFPIGVAEDMPGPDRVFISGRQSAGSRRTDRRLARFRVGIEGRISHLKRRYGLRRSRLKGHRGAKTWTAWAILAYNLDTLAIRNA